MVTWEDLDVDSNEEEENLCLIASTSYDAEDNNEVFFEITRGELITDVKDLIINYQSK